MKCAAGLPFQHPATPRGRFVPTVVHEFNRSVQMVKTVIARLSGTAVERAMYVRLRNPGKLQGLLLELFKDQMVAL